MTKRLPSATSFLERPLAVAWLVFVVAALVAGAVILKLEQRSHSAERMRINALASDRANGIQATIEHALSATYSLAAMVRQGKGLHEAGWMVDNPKASMYVWARIPEAYRAAGSLEFTKRILSQAKVSVSPGVGFGEFGDGHVRFAMIENEARTRQAIRGIKQMFREDGLSQAA